MLGRDYRIHVHNGTGAELATLTVNARRSKGDGSGGQSFEASEASLINASAVATGTYANSANQANAVDNWLGGAFEVEAVISAGVPTSDVTVRIQHSTDGGTTWPDDGTGLRIGVLTFAATGTQSRTFLYE